MSEWMEKLLNKLNENMMSYRPIPFWSWNDKLEPEELKKQIRWMYENGIGGFFMHARSGLVTEYLSDEWMACIDVCCEEAKKYGMQAWVYDENGWPSGFVGGKLLEKQDNHDMYILAEMGPYDRQADVVYRMDEQQLQRVFHEETSECLNLYLKYSASTVDILNPNVVKQFIDETHNSYKGFLGEAFSRKLSGFFTDEPQYCRWHTPYSPMVAKYFKENYGEDIRDSLGLLFVEKEGYRKFRSRYWKVMQQLMLKNYAENVYTWCDDNHVCLTGHYIEETSIGKQLWCCGGVMPFYEYEHIPGIDWLGSATDNELSPRQLGSVVRQLGKKQALTETFAACGWDTSPEELRRVAGFQFACGANMICQHLLPYSERGIRKCDYPPHFSDVNPWVKTHFRNFNEYFTRLGCLLGEAEEPVNVAVLHPMRSAYFDYKREDSGNGHGISALEQQLREACRMFSSRFINYHFLDETLLEKYGYVKGNAMGCGQCTYTYLVLPGLKTMDKKTEQLTHQFVLNGGKVLVLGNKPSFLEGEEYDYNYLESNCTFEEIVENQPFIVENIQTEIYSAYREFEGTPFLFLQNASREKSYTQTFRFSGNVKSFLALDLLTLKTKQLPLTITMAENESLVLFPSEKEIEEQVEQEEIEFHFNNAEVSFKENALVVDMVRYSVDGIHYSEPIFYKQLFTKLLEERYEGKLYLQYAFDIETLPKSISISVEDEGHLRKVNGHPIHFGEKSTSHLRQLDITEFVQLGKNIYETVVDWHQSEKTYYALFGENVTESLKNCIVYESEIEAVHLTGNFGVYSHKKFEEIDSEVICGRQFYIGKMPDRISELVTDGMPFFNGEFTIHEKLELTETNVILKLEGRYMGAQVEVNGHAMGELLFGKRIDISKVAKQGVNDIKVTYIVGNRNFMGPLHLAGTEGFVGPGSFVGYNFEQDIDGRAGYKLFRFYPKKV